MQAPMRAALLAAVCAFAGAAAAQEYPERPIRFVIGFPAGSSIDNVSRIMLDDIRARTGATIVVENRPGALGTLGLDAVVKAPADGYTMMPSSSATNSSGPHLSRSLEKLDLARSLDHVGRVVRFDVAVVAQKYADAGALIEAGRARPDALAYGYGSGTGQVIAAAFSRAAGMQTRPIAYKGQPLAMNDLIGGHIDFVAADLGAVLSHIRARTVHPVAIASARRSSILPDVPTTTELGLNEVDLTAWIGVSGPAGLSAEVIDWWNAQLQAALASEQVLERLRGMAMEPDLLLGKPFQEFVKVEYERWGAQIREAGIEPQ